ncbi:transmembrane protein, putative (macronuclear) [Tetrahymena thermophila SB210]|uniref:Transmembrane protein, putative n=1 Tax=Tetrahymena thermophila (strain SB210) TaxID=312017 RepID=I7LXB2_TETTS|nr:transmembrane protein, putative [Tetrahymena thermophila SB210]EAS04299.2 transmembrane protein, putative [Tetrahymena thermophila SB210]|eukprot:XP_001024544.2 transmembrane protein, putative [Tetrahymena thermophila SB210]
MKQTIREAIKEVTEGSDFEASFTKNKTKEESSIQQENNLNKNLHLQLQQEDSILNEDILKSQRLIKQQFSIDVNTIRSLGQRSPNSLNFDQSFFYSDQKVPSKVQDEFSQLSSFIQDLNKKIAEIVIQSEADFLKIYKQQMTEVYKELMKLKRRIEDEDFNLKRNLKIQVLTEEKNYFYKQAVFLDEKCRVLENENNELKFKNNILKDDLTNYQGLIIDVKKENKQLKSELLFLYQNSNLTQQESKKQLANKEKFIPSEQQIEIQQAFDFKRSTSQNSQKSVKEQIFNNTCLPKSLQIKQVKRSSSCKLLNFSQVNQNLIPSTPQSTTNRTKIFKQKQYSQEIQTSKLNQILNQNNQYQQMQLKEQHQQQYQQKQEQKAQNKSSSDIQVAFQQNQIIKNHTDLLKQSKKNLKLDLQQSIKAISNIDLDYPNYPNFLIKIIILDIMQNPPLVKQAEVSFIFSKNRFQVTFHITIPNNISKQQLIKNTMADLNHELSDFDEEQSFESQCDIIEKEVCVKCKDLFILEDCQSCPIGYYRDNNNTCQKCKKGEKYCNKDQVISCFAEYQLINNKCSSKDDDNLDEWYEDGQNLYYYFFYDQGIIKAKFSDDIQLLTINQDAQYQFSQMNCDPIKDTVVIQDTNQCRINPEFNNIFEIKMSISQYKRVKYNLRFINYYLSSIQYLPDNIKEDPVISDNEKIYHEINDLSKECSFKYTHYKIFGEVTIPKDHFNAIQANQINFNYNYFGQSLPLNQNQSGINIEQEGEIENIDPQRKKNFESIIDSLERYPQDLLIEQLIPVENYNIYTIFIECQYAVIPMSKNSYVEFEVVQSYEIAFEVDTFKEGDSQFFQIFIKNEISKFKVLKKDQIVGYLTIYFIEDMLKIFDQNLSFHGDYYQQEVKANEFLNGEYLFEVGIKYFLDQETQNKQVKYFKINNQNQMQLKITTNNISHMNTNESIMIQSQVMYPQTNQDILYNWSCYDVSTKQKCQDKLNIFSMAQNLQLQIPSRYLKNNNEYIIRVHTQFNKFQQNLFDEIKFKTGQFVFDIDYDESYKKQPFIQNQIIEFEIKMQNQTLENQDLLFQLEFNAQGFNSVLSKFYSQNLIQFKREEYFSSTILEKIQHINITFYVIDSITQEFTKTQQYLFKIGQPPQNCLINIQNKDQNLKAFQDEIQIEVYNCTSSSEGSLYFQFMFYHSFEEYQKELNYGKQYERNYLTKLSPSDYVKTVLPVGQIFILVIAQDKYNTKSSYSKLVDVENATLDKIQYQQFLDEQFRKIEYHSMINQNEEILFLLNMIAECIVDIENKNSILFQNDDSLTKMKDLIEQKLNILSSKFSYDNYLQEFIIRIYQKLYNQFANKDQQKNVFQDIQNIFESIKEQSKGLNQVNNEQNEQFQKQLYSSLDLIHKVVYCKNNQIDQNLSNWQNQYINLMCDIVDELALTLKPNQKNIQYDFQDFVVKVSLVNKTEVATNYLSLTQYQEKAFQKLESQYFETKQIYWKENIYFDDSQFLEIYSAPIQKKGMDFVRSQMQKYPSILITICESMKNQEIDLNRLLFQKEKQITQKMNLTIRYNFEEVEYNNKIKCIQKIDSIWTTQYCSKVQKQINNKIIVSCECKSLSFTTLITDLDYLISQDNFQNSIDGEGISKILSFSNWHQYATIYVIFGINIMFALSIFVAKKTDKKCKLFITSDFLVSLESINTQQNPLVKINSKQNQVCQEVQKQEEEKIKGLKVVDIQSDEENSTEKQNYLSQNKQNEQNHKKTQNKLEIKIVFQQYIKSISFFRAIGLFHSLFSIFLLYNKKQSSLIRICNYYCKLIWKLAINVVFGNNLTLSQIMIMSIMSSLSFALYQIIFILIHKQKKIRCLGYLFCFLFSLFSYYLILVSLANSSVSQSNTWILTYVCSLIVCILFLSILSSALKLGLAYQLVGCLNRKNIFLKFIGASLILQQLNDF